MALPIVGAVVGVHFVLTKFHFITFVLTQFRFITFELICANQVSLYYL